MTPLERHQYQAMEEWLRAHLPSYVEMLRSWVAVNSYTGNRPGVLAHAHQVTEAFQIMDFSAVYRDATDSRFGAHLALLGGSGDLLAPTVGLITHLDTVFSPEEELQQGFRWERSGNLVFGPGVNDIKGGTAMIWLMLRTLREFYPAVFKGTRWVVLANAAEEHLVTDFHQFCLSHLGARPTACLVFEAGAASQRENEFPLVVARKGRFEWKVFIEGRGAHAGADFASGANAIVQAAHLIPRLAALASPDSQNSVNISALSGGGQSNRVPARALIEGECRTFVPEEMVRIQQTMCRLCDLGEAGVEVVASSVDGFACRSEFMPGAACAPWPENPRTEALFKVWQQAGASLGFSVLRERRGGLSDGNTLASLFPTLDGLGPAGGNSHCAERSADGAKIPEYLELDSVVPKTLLNVLGLGQLLTAATAIHP